MNTPQPRYSAEYREKAIQDNRPLFTLDIYWPKGTKSTNGFKRTTVTGVLSTEELESATKRLLATIVAHEIESDAATTDSGETKS